MRNFLLFMVALLVGLGAGIKFGVLPLPDAIENAVPEFLKPAETTTKAVPPSIDNNPVDSGEGEAPGAHSPEPVPAPETITWDPADRSIANAWTVDGAIQSENKPTSSEDSFSGDRRYNHLALHTFYWRRACDIAEVNNTDCNQRVLVLAKTSFEMNEEDGVSSGVGVARRYFSQDGEGAISFSEINGGGKIERYREDHSLRLDGDLLWAARAPEQVGTWGSSGIAAINNLKFASMGYDFRNMKYDDPSKPGTASSTSVFSMNPQEMEVSQSRKWRTKDTNMVFPWGLDIVRTPGCTQRGSSMLISSASDVATFAETSASVTLANYNVNTSFQSEVQARQESETYSLVHRTDCAEFTVMLDKARAGLNDFFVDKVEKAGLACRAGDEASLECKEALREIIGIYGTHYPNSAIYGGWVTKESYLDKTLSALMYKDGFSAGTGFEKEFEVGASVSASATGGVPLVAAAEVEVTASVATKFKSGYNFDTASSATQNSLNSIKKESWNGETRGGSGGFAAENWTIAKETSIPIFVDLRPMSELLTPPFFTDEHIVDIVRPALEAEIVSLISEGERPSVDQFNKDSYSASLPKEVKLTPLSMLDFKNANDEVGIFSSKSEYTVGARKAANYENQVDDQPLAGMFNGCSHNLDDATQICSYRVRRVSDSSDAIMFEVATENRTHDYNFTDKQKKTFPKSVGGIPGLAWNTPNNPVYVTDCRKKTESNGTIEIKSECQWRAVPDNIDTSKGGRLAYFLRPAGSEDTNEGLYIPPAEANKKYARPRLATCNARDAKPECLWYVSPRIWGNKMVGFYENCDGTGKKFHTNEGDFMVDELRSKGVVVGEQSLISGIRVPRGYVVRANGGHNFSWGGTDYKYVDGKIQCLEGARNDYFRSVSVRRVTSNDVVPLRPQ